MRHVALFGVAVCLVAAPASAQGEAQRRNYVRVTGGLLLDHPGHRDFPRLGNPNRRGVRRAWDARIETDKTGAIFEGAMGRKFGRHFSSELNISYARVGADRAGCIRGCIPGGNSTPYSPEKQIGQTEIVTVTANGMASLPVLRGVTASLGGGVGAGAYMPDTSYRNRLGWRQAHGSLGLVTRGIAMLCGHVTTRVSACVRGTYDDLGKRRIDFRSDLGRQISRVRDRVSYVSATAGVTFRFGKARR